MPTDSTCSRADEFLLCRSRVLQQDFFQHGIGSLSEKAQHAILKNFYCPNPSYQEINFGKYVADIATPEGITEIQTANFGKMRSKLQCFLQNGSVRIIYPVPAIKWLVWVDTQTGETSPRRRSPNKNAALGIFRELYSISSLLWPSNFSVTLTLLECEEYRLLDGWSRDRKKGSHRSQMLPLSLLDEITLNCPQDLLKLLPSLPDTFTSQTLQKLTKQRPRTISYIISVLRALNVIEKIGTENRYYLYRIVS